MISRTFGRRGAGLQPGHLHHASGSRGAQDYAALTEELLARVDSFDRAGAALILAEATRHRVIRLATSSKLAGGVRTPPRWQMHSSTSQSRYIWRSFRSAPATLRLDHQVLDDHAYLVFDAETEFIRGL